MRIQSFVVIMAVCGAMGTTLGCGDGTSTGITDPPVVVAPPAPAPPPAVNEPSVNPTPAPCGGCEPPVTNTKPAVRLTIRVYKVQDLNGSLIDGIPPSIPLGYKVTIDATPKDANNKDTLGSGTVEFTFSDPTLVQIGSNHGFQKKLTVLGAGLLEVKASIDGIDSNSLVITLGD